jgi:hypothetical protein
VFIGSWDGCFMDARLLDAAFHPIGHI